MVNGWVYEEGSHRLPKAPYDNIQATVKAWG